MLRDKKFWIGVAISIVFLYLTFRGQDFGKIGESLSRVHYWALIPALACYFAGVWIRALRWGVLLSPVRKGIHPNRLFRFLAIGYMGNDILPARLGDVIRVYVLSRRESVTKSATLATILVERIFDGLTMIGFLAGSALFIQINADLTLALRVSTILFLAGLLVFVFLAAAPQRIVTLIRLILGRSPVGKVIPESLHERALHMTTSFVEGLSVLRNWRGLLSVMGLSVAAWSAEAAMYYIIGAWGFDLQIPVHAYTMTTAAANLGTLVPSSPGYIGVFEGIAIPVLTNVFRLDDHIAASYVVLLHAALYFPVTLLGLFYMVRESVSWSELAALEKKEAAGQPAVEEDDSGDTAGGAGGAGEMLSVPVGGAPAAGVRTGERDTAQSGKR
ncbi:MAG TPA: lysylphosphatidylglycerol synthase transmembrane domain-containing protein [Chloroflexia bacterium]|nr:lysylphosphatidylglycerol synthase transmembrane domain-containing protein [Chloroflexia bacterium]